MSYNEQVYAISLTAAADLSSHLYKFCTVGASGVALNTTAGGRCLGVIYTNDADAAGRRVPVAYSGVAKVTAGAAVAIGDDVQSDNAGLAIEAAAGDYSMGTALEAATASGDVIAVLLRPNAQANA